MPGCHCPVCNTRLNAPASLAGKKMKCPHCGEAFRLPDASEFLPVAKLEVQKSKRRLLSPFTVVGLVFATLLALGIGFWIYERRITPEMSVPDLLGARSFRGDISTEQRWVLLEHWLGRVYRLQRIRNDNIRGTMSDRDAEREEQFINLENLALKNYLLGLENRTNIKAIIERFTPYKVDTDNQRKYMKTLDTLPEELH